MKTRVRIQMTSVTCVPAPRPSGTDRFFVAGAAVSDGGHVNAVVTTPLSASDPTRAFNAAENVLFDGVLDDDGSVALALVARDDIVSKDWEKRQEWVGAIEDSIVNADAHGAAAIGAWIAAGNHVGWVMLATAIGIGISLGIYFMLPAANADTLLGQLTIVIKAGGAACEPREWFCEGNGASYTVRYEVVRTRVHVESRVDRFTNEARRRRIIAATSPASVVRGRSARMTVSAIDADTRAPVAATVRFLDLNRIFPTNVSFEAEFPKGILTGIRGAIARAFTRMPLDLFDDGFDWQALEHRTPKGLVMAAGYDAAAVMVEMS